MPPGSSASRLLIPSCGLFAATPRISLAAPVGTEGLHVRTRPQREHTQVYPFSVKRLRAFLEGLPGGHRPPTGPLTTREATDAEELRQETLAKDKERIEHGQDEGVSSRDHEVPPASGA
jgi:hypothetical protein